MLDVPPTATVTDDGPTPEGEKYWVNVLNVTDVNPEAYFDYLVDWKDTGEFERVPDSRRVELANGVRFWYVFDDDDEVVERPVTVRILDYEGGYTDYALQPNVVNVAPQAAAFKPHGWAASYSTIGPGVPVEFHGVTDPSHADHLAGFTYFYQMDNGPWVSSLEPYFILPDYTPDVMAPTTVRGYVRDKDGADSPIYTTTFWIRASGNILINHGNGSIQAAWDGGSGTLGPNQWWNGIGGNLHVTLLTNGASYTLETNADFAGIHYASGVQPTYLRIDTTVFDVTGTSKAPGSPNGIQPHFVGWGRVGVVEVPGPGPAGTPMTLRIFARGDLDSVVGPDYFGLEGINAIEIECRNLLNSITGIDSIQGLRARYLLGDDPDDLVRVNTGIGALGASRINARIIADAFFDGSDLTLTAAVGHGGLARIDVESVAGFDLQGDAAMVRMNDLLGALAIAMPTTVDDSFFANVAQCAQITGVGNGLLARVVYGDFIATLLPTVLSLTTADVEFTKSNYRQQFWKFLTTFGGPVFAQVRDTYRIHHTKQQALRDRYATHADPAIRTNVDHPDHLRAVHPDVHWEITAHQNKWRDDTMRKMGLNPALEADHKRFWKTVDMQEVIANETKLETVYKDKWISIATEKKVAGTIVKDCADPKGLAGWKLLRARRASRIFAKIGFVAAYAELFSPIVRPALGALNDDQAQKWSVVQQAHNKAIDECLGPNGRVHGGTMKMLHESLIAYLLSIEYSEERIADIDKAMTVFRSEQYGDNQ